MVEILANIVGANYQSVVWICGVKYESNIFGTVFGLLLIAIDLNIFDYPGA